MTLFDSWLAETRKLQVEAYKADYSQWSTDPEGEGGPEAVQRLANYISWNTKAAAHELVELDQETSWKPWQHDDPYVNRKAVIKEAVDALHFISNVLCAVGCSDEELDSLYREKMAVNRERQLRAQGYRVNDPGVKCMSCRRALDDVEPSETNPNVCKECDDAA